MYGALLAYESAVNLWVHCRARDSRPKSYQLLVAKASDLFLETSKSSIRRFQKSSQVEILRNDFLKAGIKSSL